jgi:hypothetical protein
VGEEEAGVDEVVGALLLDDIGVSKRDVVDPLCRRFIPR